MVNLTDVSESGIIGAVTTVEGIEAKDVMYFNITLCVMEARELFAMSGKEGV